MAGAVDVGVGELAKLGERVKIKKSVLLKIKRSGEEANSESQVMRKQQLDEEEYNNQQVKAKKDNTLLESTVFMLLMDSFAPS